MKLTRIIALLALLCLPGLLFAQDKPEAKGAAKAAGAPKATAKPQGMPMPATDPEMKKLSKIMAGTWTVTETAPPSEMMPKGGTGHGEAVISRGPGGNSLLQNYHSQSAMGKFAGHGVIWYDPQDKGFKNIWCDTMTPGGCAMFNGTGKWEGDKLVFSGTQDMMGKAEQVKETISDVTPHSFTFTIESGADANSMKTFMTLKYAKRAGGAAGMKSEEKAPAKP